MAAKLRRLAVWRDGGLAVGRRRTARLMRENGLRASIRDDLVLRLPEQRRITVEFSPSAGCRTYVPIHPGQKRRDDPSYAVIPP